LDKEFAAKGSLILDYRDLEDDQGAFYFRFNFTEKTLFVESRLVFP